VLCQSNRGGGSEADRWAAATVSGGGVADKRGPLGSGREERGADRRDQPVSGRGQRGGCGLHGARVGRPGKEKVGRAQMNSGIWDLFKSVLNMFKLI
jgi:hypothetical protein